MDFDKEMKYEVVCTESYLDVGLLIEKTDKRKPKRVLARSSVYSNESEYGGVETLTWIKTGVFLSRDDWERITYNKSTDQILSKLGIRKRKKVKSKNKNWIRGLINFLEKIEDGL